MDQYDVTTEGILLANVKKCTHGVFLVYEKDGWRICEPRKEDVGVIHPDWNQAVRLFENYVNNQR